jgi:hypothetical protein
VGGPTLARHERLSTRIHITMAELISVTLINGRTEIINLDYVVKIEEARDQQKSSITLVTNFMPMLVIPTLVKGTPSEIASAHRIRGT